MYVNLHGDDYIMLFLVYKLQKYYDVEGCVTKRRQVKMPTVILSKSTKYRPSVISMF